MDQTSEDMARKMEEARTNTLAIFDLADESFLHESPGFGFRPIIWHLAHIGVFESYWLLQRLAGKESLNARFDKIFDPINTPRKASTNLPSRNVMERYLATVRSEVLAVLEKTKFVATDPLLKNNFLFNLVLQHEYQHQETLAYLFQMLDPGKKYRPAFVPHESLTSQNETGMVDVPDSTAKIGAEGDLFAYDNELPFHDVIVQAFRIDRLPVTNAEFAVFVEEGGYLRPEFWSKKGWALREADGWTNPLYWKQAGQIWLEKTMFDEESLRPNHPVTGISWYEAEAYANFAGKRLPTEFEWEVAAAWNQKACSHQRFAWGDAIPDEAFCNFDFRNWGTTPAGAYQKGAGLYGTMDMTGNVWEWTSSPFYGYPGFEVFPYPEYSQEWFDGDHVVLKGGSWATRAPVLRTSFRNFFRPHFRIAFAGFRCAISQ